MVVGGADKECVGVRVEVWGHELTCLRNWASQEARKLHNLGYGRFYSPLAQVNWRSPEKLNESCVGSSSCWQLTQHPHPHQPKKTTHIQEGRSTEDKRWGSLRGLVRPL